MKTTETTAENYGILEKFPNFYKQAFICYNLCKKINKIYDSNSTESFLLQPIWLNTRFKFKGKTLYFENWVKSGIRYV